MRTFDAGTGRIQRLQYTQDGKHLVVDIRGTPTGHPWMGFEFRPARELVWWDWVSGQPVRRFRLRDALFGPGGACLAQVEKYGHGDSEPDGPAFDVSFCFNPWRIATAWEWSNKEDGNCVYDADAGKYTYLSTPYKAHTMRLALAPDGSALAAATVNDMDGSALIERWDLFPEEDPQGEEVGGWRGDINERIRAERENSVRLEVDPESFLFDGRFVAAGGPASPQVQCWDTETPVDPALAALKEDDPAFRYGPLREADLLEPGFAASALAFGSGHLLAIGGGGLVVWHPHRREYIPFPQADAAITALAFGIRAEYLVAGTASGTLDLWHVESRSRVRSLAGGVGAIEAVAFSPDGLTCAAGGENGKVIIWDVDA